MKEKEMEERGCAFFLSLKFQWALLWKPGSVYSTILKLFFVWHFQTFHQGMKRAIKIRIVALYYKLN